MKTIEVKDSRIYGLISLYDMHTEYFKRALADITDAAAQSRLDTQANHMAWLTGSLVQSRFELATMFGNHMQQMHFELFRDFQGIKDGVEYPPLADFISDWNRVSPLLRELLCNVGAAKLDSMFEMPGMTFPYYELVSFTIYREANCIGQLALWRRLLGYPALKYD